MLKVPALNATQSFIREQRARGAAVGEKFRSRIESVSARVRSPGGSMKINPKKLQQENEENLKVIAWDVMGVC